MSYLSYPKIPKPSMSFHGLARNDLLASKKGCLLTNPLSIGPVLSHPFFNPLTSPPYQEISEARSWSSGVNIAQVSFLFSCTTCTNCFTAYVLGLTQSNSPLRANTLHNCTNIFKKDELTNLLTTSAKTFSLK